MELHRIWALGHQRHVVPKSVATSFHLPSEYLISDGQYGAGKKGTWPFSDFRTSPDRISRKAIGGIERCTLLLESTTCFRYCKVRRDYPRQVCYLQHFWEFWALHFSSGRTCLLWFLPLERGHHSSMRWHHQTIIYSWQTPFFSSPS